MLEIHAAEAPITEDDAFIAEALESASIPTLMMALIHITGDPGLLDGPIRPGPAAMGGTQGGLPEEERAQVRAHALEVLKAFRDGGCRLPPPPSHETIIRMMSFMVGEEVPDEYLPMMLEEMALDGDHRDVHWDDVPAEARKSLRVLVIGAGMSGLLAAIRLEEAGIPYVVVEKDDHVGGTWYENSYPGCRVDVPNHFYAYSFEPNHEWSEYYSQRDELVAYFEHCATKYGVRPHIRFNTEVTRASWDEDRGRWSVQVRPADGDEETLEFSAVISGCGLLNRPKYPDIPGLDDFEGPCFHSARWRHDVPLDGKRVAVIGTGASAFQLVPEIAKITEHTVVFQRSPGWMGPNPLYHERVPDGKKWLLEKVPFYARWYRFLLFWPASDALLRSFKIDPDWPHPERSVGPLNEERRVQMTEYIASQVGDDPELLEKVVPKYPPFVKRILQDNGSWLGALRRPDVDLQTSGIERVTAKSVIAGDGSEYPVDAIVLATGFHANRFLYPMDIVGRDGVVLSEKWGDDPRAYLGITAPGFPNLFLLYGPGTNLAHAGSIIFHSECQVRYILGCLKALLREGRRVIECRDEVNEAFNERRAEAVSQLVLSHGGTTSWYKNSRGEVTVTSPWRLVDYWSWTRRPDLSDFELR